MGRYGVTTEMHGKTWTDKEGNVIKARWQYSFLAGAYWYWFTIRFTDETTAEVSGTEIPFSETMHDAIKKAIDEYKRRPYLFAEDGTDPAAERLDVRCSELGDVSVATTG